MSQLRLTEIAAASVPTAPTGKLIIFVDSADKLTKSKDDAGNVVILSGDAAVTAHEAALDPHPQYLTLAEGNAAYTTLAHVGTGGTAHANATTSVAGFMSAADKTKIDGIGGSRIIKSGVITAASFTGNPKKSTLTFGTAFSSANYSVVVLGGNSRSWSFESKVAASVVINANANAALSQDVLWIAIDHGESVE